MTAIPEAVSPTVAAIYKHYEDNAGPQWDSYGISFSMLGDECDRLLWYMHHWTFREKPIDGQKRRLFDTGKREEDRIIDELKAIGVQITNEQEKVRLCGGHLRGKIEGEALGLPSAPKTKHTFEIKTHKNTSFNAIKKHGLKKQNFKHYVQTLLGVHAKGNARGAYIMNCKNSDDMWEIRLTPDPLEIAQWLARAERIITADEPPAKLHEDPEKKAAFKCQYCPAKGVCHDGAWARVNCRTCIHSTVVMEGAPSDWKSWRCELRNTFLDMDEQRAGCADHRYIPKLVPGEQTDYEPEGTIIHYALHDGEGWKDTGAVMKDGAWVKA